MSDFSNRLLVDASRGSWISRLRPVAFLFIPFFAILFQVYVRRLVPHVSYLQIPVLLTVYFGLMWRSPIAAVLFGAGVGLAEDALSSQPIGMYGIVKTLVGYFAASVSLRFDVDNPVVRFLLSFFFFFFHQFFYWVLARALLGQNVSFDPQQNLIYGLLNAAVAVPLFLILDRMKVAG